MTYSSRTCISPALTLVVLAGLKDVPTQQKLYCKLAPRERLICAALFLRHPSGCPHCCLLTGSPGLALLLASCRKTLVSSPFLPVLQNSLHDSCSVLSSEAHLPCAPSYLGDTSTPRNSKVLLAGDKNSQNFTRRLPSLELSSEYIGPRQ